MTNKIRIATRASPLAIEQAKIVRECLVSTNPSLASPDRIEILPMRTTGDKIQSGSLSLLGGKGQFTKRIIGRKQGSYDTRAIDMDADGDLDVLIAGHTSNNVVWFENPLGKETASADWPQAAGPEGNLKTGSFITLSPPN